MKPSLDIAAAVAVVAAAEEWEETYSEHGDYDIDIDDFNKVAERFSEYVRRDVDTPAPSELADDFLGEHGENELEAFDPIDVTGDGEYMDGDLNAGNLMRMMTDLKISSSSSRSRGPGDIDPDAF